MKERLRVFVSAIMAAVIMMAVSMVWVNPAHAATITVSTTTDERTANGTCSLREAIQNFNDNANTYTECGAPGDPTTISLPAGTYDLTLDAATLESFNVTGDLDITRVGTLTIQGAGAATTIIDGQTLTTLTHPERLLRINFAATVIVNGLTFQNGNTTGVGGAIYIVPSGNLTVNDSTFSGNKAESGGGAICNNTGTSLTVSNSTFTGNMTTAAVSGGAIYALGDLTVNSSTFTGNTATTAGASGGAIFVAAGSATVNSSTFTSNAASRGGAVYSNGTALNITNSLFQSNNIIGTTPVISIGGAIYLNEGSNSIRNTIFDGNTSYDSGGAIAAHGGTDLLTIESSSFRNNSSTFDLGGAIETVITTTITNSTFYQNTAPSGAAIDFSANANPVSLVNNTFAYNVNTVGAHGTVANFAGVPLTMINNVIAYSTGPDCTGTVTTNTRNFIKDNTCSPALSGDPKLGAAENSGLGGTLVFPLQAGSPAIDAGDNASCLATDQRGTTRPQNGICDIGAYESSAAPVPPVTTVVSITGVSNITGSTVLVSGTATGTGIGEPGFYWWIPPTAENHFGGSESGLIPSGTYGAGDFSLNITGLKPGNSYHIKAYVKVGGQIITSDEQTFTTPTTGATGKTAPTVTTTSCTLNADGTVTAAGQITDVGTSPVNVYGFLYAKHPYPFTGDNGDTALAMWDKAPVYQSLSFTGTIGNLAPGKWYLRAYAHNDNPDSDAAQTASLGYGEDCTFTVPGDIIVPTAPGGLTGVAKSPTQIDLAWTDNSTDETGFRIFRDGTELLPSPKAGANVTTFSDTGLTCGKTYTYTVKAMNADGDSAATSAVTVTTPACTVTIPAASSGLTATAKSQTQIDLAWTDNSSNETGFKIFRDGVELLPSPKVVANVTTFSDTGVTCGTTYTYTVKAVNAAGDSAGVTATATTPACASGAPTAPGGLTATAVSQTQINLLWTDNSSDETGFKLFRNGVLIKTTGANVTTFSDTGLTCGVTYTYIVKATNAAGDSAGVTASATAQACAYIPPYIPPYVAPYVPPFYDTGSPYKYNQVADYLYVSTEVNKSILLALTGSVPDAASMFMLMLTPLTYTVVTQPLHGTLNGTGPYLTYKPNQDFIGTDYFIYRVWDGTAYSSAPVQIIVHQNTHANIGDKYEMDIFCAEYDGEKYGFRLNLTPVAADPSAYYWKGDLSTFGKAYSDSNTKGCISVGKDLHLNVPTAVYRGTVYQFTLNYTPVSGDAFGFYWKMDLSTLKTR